MPREAEARPELGAPGVRRPAPYGAERNRGLRDRLRPPGARGPAGEAVATPRGSEEDGNS